MKNVNRKIRFFERGCFTMVKEYQYGDTTQLSEHFNAKEFQCKCGKPHSFFVSEELIANLEILRSTLDCRNIHISSGFRCPEHDVAVGGKGNGKHTKGLAADTICYDKNGNPISSKLVSCKAQDIGFKGIANIKKSYTSTHLDMREGKKWYGDETKGTSWACDDFYEYYGIPRDNNDEDDNMSDITKRGMDISYCQKKVTWSKVKGIDFAILRAGYGRYTNQKDSMFESHYAGAKSVNIPVGAYWYSYATTPEDAKKEADACIEILKGKQFEYPIYYDVEENKQLQLGKSKVSEIIRAFLERVEAAGYWVGLYMSASPMSTLVEEDITKRYAIWVANVGVSKPQYYKGPYGMWQYSWKGVVDGITGDVDMDYGYVDYPTMIKAKGLNGFGTPTDDTDDNKCPYPEPTKAIREGDTGDSVKWLQWNLIYLGYFNDEINGVFDIFTLGSLLAYQLKNNLAVDGVCGSATRSSIISQSK